MPAPSPPSAHVVGASGLVGRELVTILTDNGWQHTTGPAVPASCDICFLATPEAASRTIAREIRTEPRHTCTIIDLSSAHRLDDGVPLVVPTLNGELLAARPSLIASPNCTATILALALAPLRPFGIERVCVTTCQAAAGGGEAALTAMESETRASLDGAPQADTPWAFNTFCHESPIDPATGRSGEEQKVIDETRRLLDLPALDISPTCLRVPARRTHVESITLTLRNPVTIDAARKAIAASTDLRLLDDHVSHCFPSSHSADGRDAVDVGHLRADGHCISLMAAGDQLRIGAALNAFRIAEALIGSHP